MKVRTIIGESLEKSEVKFKQYSGGLSVVDSGDSFTEIKGKKPIMEVKLKLNPEQKREVLNKPNNFKFSKGRLVSKAKNE